MMDPSHRERYKADNGQLWGVIEEDSRNDTDRKSYSIAQALFHQLRYRL